MLLGASMLFLDDPGKVIQIVRRSLPVPWNDAGRRRKRRDKLLEVQKSAERKKTCL
jgi:uncharacterized membrane protein (UPF0127 family)